MKALRDDVAQWFKGSGERIAGLTVSTFIEDIGTVGRVADGVAEISGLAGVRQDELLDFGGGRVGMAVILERDRVGCVLLSPWDEIAAGAAVRGTGEVVRVPVGETLVGRVVDPLGRPLDGEGTIDARRREPVDRPAPAIIDRDLVTEPLQTGITVVDAMIPLGRGQRELIVGDRQTGKTSIAVDAIISQRSTEMICVYVAIGQKTSSVSRVVDAVRRYGVPERCIFIVGEADAPPGMQWIAPYAACTMAEYFRDRGQHALLVLDDLSKHAAVHRQIALLLRRPPGREAYPGDVFHIHARLLERAAKLDQERGGGSLTALAIAETQGGNLTAYIPTNLISITDGQIYLEPRLFYEGQKPAVDVGKSVSRVGGKTQAPVIRDLAQSLRLEYAQFVELEAFTRFGAVVDDTTRRAIEHGRRIRAVLVQPEFAPLRRSQQAALLVAVEEGLLDAAPVSVAAPFREAVCARLDTLCPAIGETIEATGQLDAEQRRVLAEHLRTLVAEVSETWNS